MKSGSPTANALSHLVGSGAGAGLGLMFVLAGLLEAATGLRGYAFPAVRNVETLIPDHDAFAPGRVEAAEDGADELGVGVRRTGHGSFSCPTRLLHRA